MFPLPYFQTHFSYRNTVPMLTFYIKCVKEPHYETENDAIYIKVNLSFNYYLLLIIIDRKLIKLYLHSMFGVHDKQ